MVEAHFTSLDWIVIASYLVLTTFLGHKLSGKQKNLEDFFLGGHSLPWYAVTGSIIATAISAITFIGVPSIVYAKNGNWTYLQLAIGSIIARWLVGRYLIRHYYQSGIFSPYDYIEKKIGGFFGKLASLLFLGGGVLGQGVRVYATALVLQMITGWPLLWSIFGIVSFSVLWSWIGGISAVIWTDAIQFVIFFVGAIIAVLWMLFTSGMGTGEMFSILQESSKLQIFNFQFDFSVPFTFWAAILAMPFQNFTAYGIDQLNTQRMLCCKNPLEAKKAIYWSCVSEVITVLMLVVGSLLFVYYQAHPMSEEVYAWVQERTDRIFPYFIVTSLPPGVTGIFIAAIFSAAISSLDSVLTALSQVTMVNFFKFKIQDDENSKKSVFYSRVLVLFWGVVLGGMAIVCATSKTQIIHLAFSAVSYTYGALFAILCFSFFGKKENAYHLKWSIPLGVLTALLINRPEWFKALTSLEGSSNISWPWVYPLAGLVGCIPLFFSGKTARSND